MRAIYSITNIDNNKMYIGETMDVKRRWEEHEEELNDNKHHSYKLQQDWNELGKEKFEFNVVAVLDESISNYIDKYILLLYEGYYTNQYNSIENGYNIENTLIEVMNDRKIIFNKNDKSVLKTCYKRIEKGEIVRKGNLIFTAHVLNFKDLCIKLNKESKEVKYLMLQENIIISNGNKKYNLIDMYKNDDIILEDGDKLSNMTFSEIGLELMYNKLKELNIKPKIKEKHVNNETKYTDIKINNPINNEPTKYIENNKIKCTMKDFLTDYTMNTSYNDVFRFLRTKEILKYIVREDGKNNNCPTDKYKHWFICEDATNKTGTKYIRMYLTEAGKQGIYKILSDNYIISNLAKVN